MGDNKPEVGEFMWHELLDRTHCVIVMWDEIVKSHPACEQTERLRKMAGIIEGKLGDFYQAVGAIRFEVGNK